MKPDGELAGNMDDCEMEPSEFFSALGMLVVESRVPEISEKGRAQSPHCPTDLGHVSHKHHCNSDDSVCQRVVTLQKQMSLLWRNQIPMCIEVLLFSDCHHGRRKAVSTDVTLAGGNRDDCLLLEQWTIQVVPGRSAGSCVCPRVLFQAIKSYLYFSQLSAWLNMSHGSAPRTVAYRISPPGEFCTSRFVDPPEWHHFPGCSLPKLMTIKTTVASVPRRQCIPKVLCTESHNVSDGASTSSHHVTNSDGHRDYGNGYHSDSSDHSCHTENGQFHCDDNLPDEASDREKDNLVGNGFTIENGRQQCNNSAQCNEDYNVAENGNSQPPERSATGNGVYQQQGTNLLDCSGHIAGDSREFQQGYFSGLPTGGAVRMPFNYLTPQLAKQTGAIPKRLLSCDHDSACKLSSSRVICTQHASGSRTSETTPVRSETTPVRRELWSRLVDKGTADSRPPDWPDGDQSGADIPRPKVAPWVRIPRGTTDQPVKFSIGDEEKEKSTPLDASNGHVAPSCIKRVQSCSQTKRTFHKSVSAPTCESVKRTDSLLRSVIKKELAEHLEGDDAEISAISQKAVPSAEQRHHFQRTLNNSSNMLFHSALGLPLQSSPAPIKKITSGCFDFDNSLTSVRAIKNSLSCVQLDKQACNANVETEETQMKNGDRFYSASAPASTNSLLGNFEESLLNGRIEPTGVVEGFSADIGASGHFCPKHITTAVTAFFFRLSEDNAPSPYLGHINLESVGKRGYHVPKCGTVQVTLFNPNKAVVKMFVVRYDLQDMPPSSQTFLRQRTLYVPVAGSKSDIQTAPSYLRYLIHLRFATSKYGKLYLHTDIRLIFARDKFEYDARIANYELRSFTEGPTNPKFSPKR